MLAPRQTGRSQPIRLQDVPLTIRRRHGRRLIDAALADGDLFAAVDLTRAVEEPSDHPYWVPVEAVRRVLGHE